MNKNELYMKHEYSVSFYTNVLIIENGIGYRKYYQVECWEKKIFIINMNYFDLFIYFSKVGENYSTVNFVVLYLNSISVQTRSSMVFC